MFSSRFHAISNIKKKKMLSKKFRGGGGGVLKKIFFFRKQFFLISRFILFSTLKNNNIEKFPFTYWLNGGYFQHLKKKCVSKKFRGGGGGC